MNDNFFETTHAPPKSSLINAIFNEDIHIDTLTHRKSFNENFSEFRSQLRDGKLRAAELKNGRWVVNTSVKKQILQGFKQGKTVKHSFGGIDFFDKDTLPMKTISLANNIRVVPGGTSLRDGCYIADTVTIMPPSFVNIGAYVDEHTLIDSHVLVGSCAQVGKRVHLSAGVVLGGVLEPIGGVPVIIEDNVFIGGNSGIYGGVIVQQGAIIAAGTTITDKTPIYDLVHNKVYKKEGNSSLVVPANAVVVSGTRTYGKSEKGDNIAIQTPVIVKYNSDAIQLENSLR
ncbi:MAG: 2,3,4,5-tetrahydropyridine-2,6-dicarboxylate N-succinyltransferase [Desulforhopalus sp.]